VNSDDSQDFGDVLRGGMRGDARVGAGLRRRHLQSEMRHVPRRRRKANTPAGQAFKAASFSDPAIIKIPDSDRIVIVKKGKNKMPVFGDKLTDDQIKSVLAYVRTLEK